MTVLKEVPLGWPARIGLLSLVMMGPVLAAADPFTLVFYLSYASVGFVLAIRRPRNIVSWLLIGIAWSFLATLPVPDIDMAALVAGTGSLRDTLVAWFGSWGGQAQFVGYLALTLLFPTGRLPIGRWRWPAAALMGLGISVVVLSAVAPTTQFNPDAGPTSYNLPNPAAILPDLWIWSFLPMGEAVILVIGLVAIGAASMVVRFRRATGIVRLQLRWFVASMAFVVLAVVAAFGMLLIFGEENGQFVWIPAIFAYPTVPLAIGVAVMRYRLYEIDRIISRTIAYASITAILGVVFVGAVLLLQSALTEVTQGRTVAVAASTLAVFALFQPIRRRVQRAVDHRFDRSRYDARQTVASFAETLRRDHDLGSVNDQIVATATAAVRPTGAAVWIRATSR